MCVPYPTVPALEPWASACSHVLSSFLHSTETWQRGHAERETQLLKGLEMDSLCCHSILLRAWPQATACIIDKNWGTENC